MKISKLSFFSFCVLYMVIAQSNIHAFSEEKTLIKLEKPIRYQDIGALHVEAAKHEHKDWVNKVRCYLRDRFRICF